MVKILPELKKEYDPDLVIANVENIAHGSGVTRKTLQVIKEAGVDIFTSGNHVFRKPEGGEILQETDSLLLRPANYPDGMPGVGYRFIEVGSRSILLINLIGRVFMKDEVSCPFKKVDEILAAENKKPENLAGIIIDFHAEATSEKVAFGWYLDGRVSAVLGTHTHVPTADAKILPQGTAYVSDVGMVGATDSVIGDVKEPVIESFLNGTNHSMDIPESGTVDVNAVLLTLDPKSQKALELLRVDRKIEV